MSAPRDCTTGCRVNRVRRFVRKGGFGGKPGPRPAETGGTHGSGVAGRRSPDARGAETDAVRWTAGVESPVSKGNAQVEAPIGARDEAHCLLRTEERGRSRKRPLGRRRQ